MCVDIPSDLQECPFIKECCLPPSVDSVQPFPKPPLSDREHLHCKVRGAESVIMHHGVYGNERRRAGRSCCVTRAGPWWMWSALAGRHAAISGTAAQVVSGDKAAAAQAPPPSRGQTAASHVAESRRFPVSFGSYRLQMWFKGVMLCHQVWAGLAVTSRLNICPLLCFSDVPGASVHLCV